MRNNPGVADDDFGFDEWPWAEVALAGQGIDRLTTEERDVLHAYAHNGFEHTWTPREYVAHPGNREGRRGMSALTQETWRARRVKLTPEQVEANRREAERLLGRKLPPRPTPTTADKRDQ